MKKILLILLILPCLLLAEVGADQHYFVHRCNLEEDAKKAKDYLEKLGYFIYFCSNCDHMVANIRRIDIENIELGYKKGCGHYLYVAGKVVRGVKPPVFGGYCSDSLEVSNRSVPVDGVPFARDIDLAFTYVPDGDGKFITLAEKLGMEVEDLICIRSIEFTRGKVLDRLQKRR